MTGQNRKWSKWHDSQLIYNVIYITNLYIHTFAYTRLGALQKPVAKSSLICLGLLY